MAFFSFAANNKEKLIDSYISLYDRFVLLGLAIKRISDCTKERAELAENAKKEMLTVRRRLEASAMTATQSKLVQLTDRMYQLENIIDYPESYILRRIYYKPTEKALTLMKNSKVVICVKPEDRSV